MKSSFLKLGKRALWFDVGKDVMNNSERFTPEDYEYIGSQTLAKEIVVPSAKVVEILPAKQPYGRDLYQNEITRIYKYDGKYFVNDDNLTKAKLGLGIGAIRVIDIPNKMKGYKTKCKKLVNFRAML